jgi:hypothetical protein
MEQVNFALHPDVYVPTYKNKTHFHQVPEQPPPASDRWSDSWHKIKAISGCLMPSLWWMLRWQDGDKKKLISTIETKM